MRKVRLTDKQRQAVEALEAARREGCTLKQYATANGLNVQRIYMLLAALRRRAALPKFSGKGRDAFVAVRVQPAPTPSSTMSCPVPAGGVVCRIVRRTGEMIECYQWPSASWILALSAGVPDAAP